MKGGADCQRFWCAVKYSYSCPWILGQKFLVLSLITENNKRLKWKYKLSLSNVFSKQSKGFQHMFYYS